MQIHSLQAAHATQSVGRTSNQPSNRTPETAAKVNTVSADQLDLSAEAQQISQLQATSGIESVSGGIRTEKVAAIRQAISEGTYETPEKLSAALDQLLDTFA